LHPQIRIDEQRRRAVKKRGFFWEKIFSKKVFKKFADNKFFSIFAVPNREMEERRRRGKD